ncbi:hydroxypyruvate isomerase family protein [Jiella flava]|uniref:hydroxypyruvate isomerase family protein n=1 Tax=Jiella flava TaxID=2816857 RepID=UPI0031B86301
MVLRLSANLGFLFADQPLPEAIRAARAAGFDAVECHWPYDVDPGAVRAALVETGLSMVSLNTGRGSRDDDFGLAAVPGREIEARAAISAAIAYGQTIGAASVHVLAGRAAGEAAARTFEANLAFACECAAPHGMTVLIEPLNPQDAPGYYLIGLDMAVSIIERLARPELKILFDCYHQQITGGDLFRRFAAHLQMIGHVQFAGVPDRGVPNAGEVAFDRLLPALQDLGYAGPFGAEYRPAGATEDSLGWMSAFRRP